RYPLRRLEAEAVRDRILATAGRLSRTPFGPPVPLMEDVVGQVGVPGDRPRRSVYLQARRSKPVAVLAVFDAPSRHLHRASRPPGVIHSTTRRTPSTAAPQSLMLMHGDFVLQHAGHFARRLLREAPPAEGRIARAWQLAYQRPPSPEESALAAAYLQRQAQQ